jgi:hypothetical protein
MLNIGFMNTSVTFKKDDNEGKDTAITNASPNVLMTNLRLSFIYGQ